MATQLPLSKIKKMAKFDDDVVMINSDAVFALATATETFIALLAKEVHMHAVSGKRKTLQQRDFDDTLRTVPWLDFLDGALVGWDDVDDDDVEQAAAPDDDVTEEMPIADAQPEGASAVDTTDVVVESPPLPDTMPNVVDDTVTATTAIGDDADLVTMGPDDNDSDY